MPSIASSLLALAATLGYAFGRPSRPLQAGAPFHRPGGDEHSIDGLYIVRFHDNHGLQSHYQTISRNLSETGELISYMSFFSAYHARLQPDLLDLVLNDPGVQYVEQDQRLSYHQPGLTKLDGIRKRWDRAYVDDAYWPQIMMSKPDKQTIPITNGGEAAHVNNNGVGVNMYIMDSGVRGSHLAFQDENGASRVKNFKDSDTSEYCNGETMEDVNGHGTAVASAAGSGILGLADGVTIISVKTNCDSGTGGRALAAVNDVAIEHTTNRGTNDPAFRGSILVMAFSTAGNIPSKAWSDVTNLAAEGGLHMLSASGNEGDNMLHYPCGYAAVICVGAVDASYKMWSGTSAPIAVEIYGPGADVPLASNVGDDDISIVSGTSAATGYVAGVLATFVGWERLISDPIIGRARLRRNSLKGVLEGLPPDAPEDSNSVVNNGIFQTPQDGEGILPYLDAPSNEPAAAEVDTAANVGESAAVEVTSAAIESTSAAVEKRAVPTTLTAVRRIEKREVKDITVTLPDLQEIATTTFTLPVVSADETLSSTAAPAPTDDCFVPSGCENLAAPDGCAVACT